MRGGLRPGAGRPRGQGKYGEATKPVRIPQSLVAEVLEFVERKGGAYPLYATAVQAGFPSPADDFSEGKLDLNALLVKHPQATFFVRVAGESMVDAGIHEGDILVVDKSLDPKPGKIVIAALDGQLTVKRLQMRDGVMLLMPENPDYTPIEVNEDSEMVIWGVVTSVIKAV